MLIVTLGKTNFGERLRSFKRQVMCLTSAVRIIWVPGYVCIWNVIRKYEFQAGICCPESEANVPYVGWLKVWIPFTWKSSDSSNNIHSYILEYIMCVCVCVCVESINMGNRMLICIPKYWFRLTMQLFCNKYLMKLVY